MIPILTPTQSRAWDADAESAGRSLRMLMETAGRAVARQVLARHGEAARQGVLVVCGPGNNGGDGWVAARALWALGVPVAVVECAVPGPGIAADARHDAIADFIGRLRPDSPWPAAGLIVDALLGTGARGAPRPRVARMVERIRESGLPVVAVDGPTGLDLLTGEEHGAVPAATTVTFGGLRRGHLLARDVVGDLVVADIGLPAPGPAWPRFVDRRWAAARLPEFDPGAHKGSRGRVVIVGGTDGMEGAARIAARAAFATGAGLVHVATTPASAAVLRAAEPDVQVGAHRLDGEPDGDLVSLVERADAVLVGPGLGRDPSRLPTLLAVLAAAQRLVVDADALNLLADSAAVPHQVLGRCPTLLTPHPGEFLRLFPDLVEQLPHDPWQAAAEACERTDATVLLKGVPTVVAAPTHLVLTVAAGNPGLATGGSGDLLGGIAATLLAQRLESRVTGAVAAQALGDAADLAARRHGARGMRPMDVVAALAETWQAWRDEPPFGEELLALPRPITA